MINLVKNVIQKHPEWLREKNSVLSYMKVSTPTSGLEAERGKVLLFVFEHDYEVPTLCVKTARVYIPAGEIKRNYEKLKLLDTTVKGSAVDGIFAKPLYFYDDDKVMFCVETALPGTRFSANPKDLSIVVEQYTAWQELLVRNEEKWKKESLEKYAYDLIDSLVLDESEKSENNKLRNFFDSLHLDVDIELPRIIQHGDMSPDNVLMRGDKVQLIDYDYVGISTIPGFDLWNFISKVQRSSTTLKADCEKYFPNYFKRIGAHVKSLYEILFIHFLEELRRKKYVAARKSANELINNFTRLLDLP